jgi:hypothetical protein
MMKKKHNYSVIYTPADHANISCTVHIPTPQLKDWERIKNNHTGNYYMTTLLRSVLRLAVGDRPVVTQATVGDFTFSYTTSQDRKNIYIHLVEITDTTAPQHQTSGLYKANWIPERDRWDIKDGSQPSTSMDLSNQWFSAHMAAIPGKFESKERAARAIGDHLEQAYYPSSDVLRQIRNGRNHYSLFWLNNDFSSTSHEQSLVSLIQQAQNQQAELKWLIHGEGCGTFVRALKWLKQNPKSQDLFVAHKGMANQEVFFSNPRGQGTAQAELEKLCKDVGINTVKVNLNKHDVLFNPDARKALRNKAAFTVGGIGFAGSAGGYGAAETGFDAMKQLLAFAEHNPSLTLTTGLFVAGGVAVIVQKAGNINAYARNLKSAWSSSVGTGNQRWAS